MKVFSTTLKHYLHPHNIQCNTICFYSLLSKIPFTPSVSINGAEPCILGHGSSATAALLVIGLMSLAGLADFSQHLNTKGFTCTRISPCTRPFWRSTVAPTSPPIRGNSRTCGTSRDCEKISWWSCPPHAAPTCPNTNSATIYNRYIWRDCIESSRDPILCPHLRTLERTSPCLRLTCILRDNRKLRSSTCRICP